MPVGTKGTVKSLHPDEVRDLGAQILLGNTYHLHFRPGDELIRELGGLHRFMGWDGPILTDSGGFQVFSLRDTIARVDDEGVTFRSVYDGTRGAVHARARGAHPGEPRQRHRDVPRPGAAGRRLAAASWRRPSGGRPLWAERQRAAPRADGQLRFGIAQGGIDPELRRRSTEEIAALDFDGNAIGGLAIGEDREAMFEATDWSAALLPADRPRYFMGIGDPEGILEVIEAGVDMFDCVLPTRTARTGSALTSEGRLNLRNARFARDPAPLDEQLRLPGLRAVQPRLHPAPRQPERAARAAPALAPQSTLRDRADPRRARRDRARRVRLLQTRLAGKADVGGFLILILVLGAVWVLFVVPARRRQRSHAAMQDSVDVGDEIITAGGLHGGRRGRSTTTSCRLEIAPGVVVTLDRRAVAAVAREVEVEVEPERPEGSDAPLRTWLTCPARVVAALSSHPGRADRPRPRRRGVPRRARLAGAPAGQTGPRPAGRPRVRAEGAAAEGRQADGRRPRPLGLDHAEPRRQARRRPSRSSRSRARTRSRSSSPASTTSTRRRTSSARPPSSSSTTSSRRSSRRRPRRPGRSRRAASTTLLSHVAAGAKHGPPSEYVLFKPVKVRRHGTARTKTTTTVFVRAAGPTATAAPRRRTATPGCSTATGGKVPKGWKVLTVPAQDRADHAARRRRRPSARRDDPAGLPPAGKTDYYLFKKGAYPNDRYATAASTRT